MVWAVVAVASVAAGLIQTVTGFGSVVMLMLVLPFFFDMVDAPALALAINQLFCMVLLWQYRRHIRLRTALPPTLAYAAANVAAVRLVGGLDMRVLVIAFAIFLMALSLYFLLAAGRIRLRGSPAAGIGCGLFSGVTAGLFAVGGPPMAIYFLAAADDHLSYIACMQFLFTITGAVNVAARVAGGLFHVSLLPYAAVGTVCILLGKVLGEKVSRRLNGELMRRLVYVFVGVSGLILLLQQVL